MKKRISLLALLFFGSSLIFSTIAQVAMECDPANALPVTQGDLFLNYGSTVDAYSIKNRSNYTLGQAAVGFGVSQSHNSQMGFWAQFLIPPLSPNVIASQGELLDRIQISWTVKPLGAQPTEGFKIYRDGVFLGLVDNNTYNYNDFDVIAGKTYVYEVRGVNFYGDGPAGTAIGFQVPNGVVTGWVHTINDSPVPDAMVTLMPMQGFSAQFDGQADGAFWYNDSMGVNPMLPPIGNDWSMTFWMKTELSGSNASLLKMAPIPLFFRAINSSSGQEGIEIASSGTGQASLTGAFPDNTKNDWHHIALTYDGSAARGRLYIDGLIKDLGHMDALQTVDSLFLGSRTGMAGWKGKLDELRVYHKRLDEIELSEIMEGTASSQTPGLQYYWKFDEGQGLKSFDIMRRKELFLCSAAFDASRAPVRTAGKTNSEGYYRIESASYGTGTTFLAEPTKHFYKHRSTSLVRSEMDYDSIPNFSLTPQATLELWVNSAGPDGIQCLLSKRWDSWDFRLMLDSFNNIKCYLNGIEALAGPLGVGFQHLAITIDSSASGTLINVYQNGTALGTQMTFPTYTGNWSDDMQAWVLGARPSGMGPMNNNVGTIDNFGGLMDEFAVYDGILSAFDIQYHAEHSRDMKESGLRVYFALDEGNGDELYNSGSLFLPIGTNKGGDWSPLAANQSTTPHVFTPGTRQVTLNPSITSVDQVDFTDRSTVAVSGYVRYANTECFAQNVEILVNGETYNPIILTDSTGKFLIEMDPGTSAKLTPKLKDHQFEPADWFVINITSPRAGILFNDVTTRTMAGLVAGGHCKFPIISIDINDPATYSDCRITASTKDKCYEKTILIDNIDGVYTFENLPPLEFTLAITKHNHPLIYEDFQAQGGKSINLLEGDSLGIEFIYIAPPQLEVSGFEMFTKTACPGMPIVIDKGIVVGLDIKVFEQYGSTDDPADRCFLDSALLSINNTFDMAYDFTTPLDTFYTGGGFMYLFVADHPNEFDPYEQIIEIVADDLGRKSDPYTNKAIITGTLVGEAKFTTQLPVIPSFILRDPPGDGSTAYMEAGTKNCNSLQFEDALGGGPYYSLDNTMGVMLELTIPLIGTHLTSAITTSDIYEVETAFTYTNKSTMEYCVTNKERISTDGGDLIVGGATLLDNTANDTLAGNDIYVGIGFNVIFSDSKEITFDTMACLVSLENVVTASPDTFITNYKYSEWNLENHVIRYLDTLIANGIDQDSINTRSKRSWEAYIELNKLLK